MIPIVVGVTGHRKINKDYEQEIRSLVNSELLKIKTKYQNSEIVLLDSLASGSDQLVFEEALKLGIKLRVVLPFSKEEYLKDFEDKEKFLSLLEKAETVIVIGEEKDRDEAYRKAGIYVAEHSHVLFALWNGEKGDANKCGTQDIVEYMLKGGAHLKDGSDTAILHIFTPRENEKGEIKATLIENTNGLLEDTLEKTDRYNLDAKGFNMGNSLSDTYTEADTLSMGYQKKFDRALKWVSLFAALVAISFLLYDEADLVWCLPLYGVFFILALVISTIGKKKSYQGKYLEYRVLAESLRVELYLSSITKSANVTDCFTWTQRTDITWVRKGISALLTDSSDLVLRPYDEVKKEWIDEQLSYHERAEKKVRKTLKKNDRIAFSMLVATLCFFVLTTVLEYFAQSVIETPFLWIDYRALLKILLGSTTVVTAFLSGYYGKLSLERKADDHRKMARLFKMALIQNEGNITKEELMIELATEEIIENGNWYSYSKDNEINISI